MIFLQSPLSSTLAALLLKELPRDELPKLMSVAMDSPPEQEVIERFYNALEEHRLDLCSNGQDNEFCRAALVYLEALLDPHDISNRSGIEMTASCATNTWDKMSDEQRVSLWKEAAAIHPLVILSLAANGW